MSSVVVLGYWDIRGLAEPIRMLLEHVGAPYEDRRMNMSKPEWLQYKTGLGFDFPNLPYYEEPGGVKITQSNAILRHLARKHGLEGSSEEENVRADMLCDTLGDYRTQLTQLCYNPSFSPLLLAPWTASLGPRLQQLEDFLASSSGEWWAGSALTWVDFLAWEILDEHRLLIPGCLQGLEAINNFMERFSSLPSTVTYLAKPSYTQFPIWSVRAKFGFTKPQ